MIYSTLISTYFLRLPTYCICLKSYQHHSFRRNSSSASSLQLTHSTMSQSYFPALRVTLNVFPILCFQASQKWCQDCSHCWTGLPPTHTNTKNTYCLPSSSSPQHNHSVFFQLLPYCECNHSFVSSQDTRDRPFNSGFDIGIPTKYKDTNRCKHYTYFNEQSFGIYLRKVTSFSSNVSGLISTITAHRKYFNITRT